MSLRYITDHGHVQYMPFLPKEFLEMGLTEGGVRVKISKKKFWYEVFEGNFLLWAIHELINEKSEIWASFQWSVIILRKSPSIKSLKQIKRIDEESRKAKIVSRSPCMMSTPGCTMILLAYLRAGKIIPPQRNMRM